MVIEGSGVSEYQHPSPLNAGRGLEDVDLDDCYLIIVLLYLSLEAGMQVGDKRWLVRQRQNISFDFGHLRVVDLQQDGFVEHFDGVQLG